MAYQQSHRLSPVSILNSFISTTSTSIYCNLERKLYGLIMIRHHYNIHGWALDDGVRPYVIPSGLHGVSLLGTMSIGYASGDCNAKVMASEDPHFHLPIGKATMAL